MPKLTALIAHFEATGNRPQTVREIADALGEPEQNVRTMVFWNVSKRGLMQRIAGRPNTRYCFLGESVAPPPSPAPTKADMETIRLEFCRRWNVLAPFEATRDNPEALRDWIETLNERTAA